MEAFRSRLKASAVVALFAMLALAVLPSLSQALQSSPFAGVGVCSTPGSLPDADVASGHCPLCAQVFDGPFGPPAASLVVVATTQVGAHLTAPHRRAQPRHAWATAPARAPPTSDL